LSPKRRIGLDAPIEQPLLAIECAGNLALSAEDIDAEFDDIANLNALGRLEGESSD
jgi:hypothetical protein